MPRANASSGLAIFTAAAFEVELAAIGLMSAGDRLDEGRLAGAVVADQSLDLAGIDIEVDLTKRTQGPEELANPAQS